jgi:hypothetical protein
MVADGGIRAKMTKSPAKTIQAYPQDERQYARRIWGRNNFAKFAVNPRTTPDNIKADTDLLDQL